MPSARVLGLRVLALAATTGFVATSAAACDGLKRADETQDGGPGEDGSTSGEDGAVVDGASPLDSAPADAGPAPADFECNEPWTKATKTKPECEPRQVKVLEAVGSIDVNGISIARTPAGRVGIVFNSEQNADEGEMHLMHFTPSKPTFAAPVLIKVATGFGFHDGFRAKIAASAPDTLSVLSYDCDDTSGEVNMRRLVGGAQPLTAKELVFTAVGRPTEIGFASDSAGTVYATARIATSGTTAKLAAKTKTGTGAFTALPDVVTALLPKDAPGVGESSLFVDTGGQLHMLYHHNEVMQHSNPRYYALAGSQWTYRKTVDNQIPDGISGYSPRIATFGTTKYAAYYFRKALQTPSTAVADLRLATWDSESATPKIELIDQNIPSPAVGTAPVDLYPPYAVAMAIDKFGLVHLAIIDPSNETSGVLEYRRQTRVQGGGTKWLNDIVDPDVVSELSSAYVDLVVDESARPHIAYRSAKDGKVKYATRFDR